MMAVRTAAVAAVLFAVAPAGAVTTPSGLRGVVKRGPITPVCRVDEPCTEPAKHVTLLFARAGRVVRRSTTDVNGRYRVRLAAGLYRVRLNNSPGIGRGIAPNQVRVRDARYARVNFSIDTGIR
jgi:hypothetical protein